MQNSIEKLLTSLIQSGTCTQAEAQERIDRFFAKGAIDTEAADRLTALTETYAPTEATPTVPELLVRLNMLEEAFIEFVGMML